MFKCGSDEQRVDYKKVKKVFFFKVTMVEPWNQENWCFNIVEVEISMALWSPFSFPLYKK
jgi:hypothetical protein